MNDFGPWFNPGPFMPHGGCYLWTKGLIALHAGSDALIVLAYYSIPFTLVYFVRKRKDFQFNWMFVCFAIFILACGTTHLMEIWNIWHGDYWLAGSVKAVTALASVPTAFLLVKLMPAALALPSPSQLRKVNSALEGEIEARKRYEHDLQKKNIELASANETKTRFLASMSHELRTPLNAILGFTGTLLMRLPGPLTGQQESQLKIVEDSGKHLLSLINDLLDLARIEAGKTTLELKPIIAQGAAADAKTSLHFAAEKKGLKLQLIMPPDDIILYTDQRSLHQILINLLNNAVKFTKAGSVTLELRERELDGLAFVEFTVTDTGPGIPEADQAKLFSAYERANLTEWVEGTGLGLHLSLKLAEILGGKITLKSKSGTGSCFTLILPKE